MKTTTINGRKVHHFDSRFFEVDGKRFEVVGVDVAKKEYRIKGEKQTKTMKESTLVKMAGKIKTLKK